MLRYDISLCQNRTVRLNYYINVSPKKGSLPPRDRPQTKHGQGMAQTLSTRHRQESRNQPGSDTMLMSHG